MVSPVILHIPHDSTDIPVKWRGNICMDDKGLAQEILAMTDMHTDDLYQLYGASRLRFPVSRLVLDPERFADDKQEPMAARGMGVIYTTTSKKEKLRDPVTLQERKELLSTYYDPHHQKLTDMVEDALSTYDTCLIFDCHSFPKRSLPYELRDENEERPEICIGSDPFHTPSELVQELLSFFTDKGYSVGENMPFAGALTPMKFYGLDKRVRSIMLEIRRDLYMDETTGNKLDRFGNIQRDITDAMTMAVNYAV